MRKEANIESWKKLYEITTEIGEMKPWEYQWDMDIIYLSDDDAYISVMGHAGQTYGITVYEGEKDFDRFKLLLAQEDMNISVPIAMHLQNNLLCYWGNRDELSNEQYKIVKELGYSYRGKNKWLYFMSCMEDFMPYNLDSSEVK